MDITLLKRAYLAKTRELCKNLQTNEKLLIVEKYWQKDAKVPFWRYYILEPGSHIAKSCKSGLLSRPNVKKLSI